MQTDIVTLGRSIKTYTEQIEDGELLHKNSELKSARDGNV